MYPGEYDVCDVTLSLYPHLAGLKNMPALVPSISMLSNYNHDFSVLR